MKRKYTVNQACRISGRGWTQRGVELELTPSQARYPELRGWIAEPKAEPEPKPKARAKPKARSGS